MKFTNAIFTGTFDPFHYGHFLAIKSAYKIFKFDEVIIFISKQDPKKENAINLDHRINLVKLMLDNSKIDYKYSIKVIDNINVLNLKNELFAEISASRTIRITGSDNIIAYISSPNLRASLTYCEYAVIVRSIADRKALDKAIMSLPIKISSGFHYRIISQQEDHLQARKVRQDITIKKSSRLLSKEQILYIQHNRLYQDEID